MPLPNDGIAPDRFELRVRFGCGALFGALLAVAAMLQIGAGSVGWFVLGVAGGALVCGLLARHHGDRFWHALRDWIGWG